jgi:hypothetical protein
MLGDSLSLVIRVMRLSHLVHEGSDTALRLPYVPSGWIVAEVSGCARTGDMASTMFDEAGSGKGEDGKSWRGSCVLFFERSNDGIGTGGDRLVRVFAIRTRSAIWNHHVSSASSRGLRIKVKTIMH